MACRRITNRESARRMRLKRQEEWAAIKRQVHLYNLYPVAHTSLLAIEQEQAMSVRYTVHGLEHAGARADHEHQSNVSDS